MNFPSVSQFSIAKGTGGTNPPEMYIPLWFYSGSYAGSGNASASSSNLISKNSTGITTSSSTGAKLHTLNSNWYPQQQFAFEASLQIGNASYSAYAGLWDTTSGSLVSSSQISTNNTTFSLVRSGRFTLIPGHVYGITLWTGNASYSAIMTDASLIVFPQ